MIPHCVFAVFSFFSRVVNLLLTKLARDPTGRISALGLFCTDLAALGPYCQHLGPIILPVRPSHLVKALGQLALSKKRAGDLRGLVEKKERSSPGSCSSLIPLVARPIRSPTLTENTLGCTEILPFCILCLVTDSLGTCCPDDR